jgi:hypothetical protein
VSVPTIVPPQTRDEIIAALEKLHAESEAYWSSFETDAFFRSFGPAWSPAENVRHLKKATRPVALAMSMPRIVLRLKFGKGAGTSIAFDQLKTRYDDRLAAGGKAGAYAPGPRADSDLERWRGDVMRESADIQSKLIASVGKWRDDSLDRYRLPHPLLGNLTLREMLFFTLYHQLHHIEVVERKRVVA